MLLLGSQESSSGVVFLVNHSRVYDHFREISRDSAPNVLASTGDRAAGKVSLHSARNAVARYADASSANSCEVSRNWLYTLEGLFANAALVPANWKVYWSQQICGLCVPYMWIPRCQFLHCAEYQFDCSRMIKECLKVLGLGILAHCPHFSNFSCGCNGCLHEQETAYCVASWSKWSATIYMVVLSIAKK